MSYGCEATSGKPDSPSFHALCAPAATPRPVVERLSSEVASILRIDEIRGVYSQLGADAVGSSPADLATALQDAIERWGGLARRVGVKPE